jgi:hypothetical protein
MDPYSQIEQNPSKFFRKSWHFKFVNRVIKTITVWPCIKNGQKENTEKGIKITV